MITKNRVVSLAFSLPLLFFGFSASAATSPYGAVNLRVNQPLASGLAILTYDLVHTNASNLVVTVQVSTNGGTTYDLPASSFNGNIGLVATGLNRTVTWNMAADWPKKSTNVWFRLIAYDPSTIPAGMALIPAGSFTMGDTFGEAGANVQPLHSVYVSAFFMEKYEVTKALWDDVRSWAVGNAYTFDNVGGGKAANHPVQNLNWYDCVKWCNARSEKVNLTPAYYTDAALTQIYRTGQVSSIYVKWNTGYRLPTEAEWEKAARGGAGGTRFPWMNTNVITHALANYYSTNSYPYDVSGTRGYPPAFATNSLPYTSPVGSFAPNGYGLYDMAGNVWEWCWDWYDGAWYSNVSAIQSDCRGPASGTTRLFRGGSYFNNANNATCAWRYSYNPAFLSLDCYGFRCARGF